MARLIQRWMPSLLAKMLPTAKRIIHGPRLPLAAVAEYAGEHPGRWHQAHRAQPVPAFAPRCWGNEDPYRHSDPAAHRPLGVIDISGGGAIIGGAGAAMTPDRRLLWDVGWHAFRHAPEHSPRLRYPTRHLIGSCLSIATEGAAANYGHFLLESLPRLGVAQAAGFELSDFDRVAVAELPKGISAVLLERAGLAPGQLAFTRMRRRISADRLFATSFPGRPADVPASTAQYLRSLVPADGAPRNRRLFVRRFGIRDLSNEPELLTIAARYGFEAYDFREQPDPLRDFAAARIVAGAHGATLANIAFCSPGTRVFEIVPTDHVRTYYCTLARAAGHEYHYMAGDSEIVRPPGTVGVGRSPVHVNPVVFETALKALVDHDGGIV